MRYFLKDERISEHISEHLNSLNVDVKHRKFIGRDGAMLSIVLLTQRLFDTEPSMPIDEIDAFVTHWFEKACCSAGTSEARMEKLHATEQPLTSGVQLAVHDPLTNRRVQSDDRVNEILALRQSCRRSTESLDRLYARTSLFAKIEARKVGEGVKVDRAVVADAFRFDEEFDRLHRMYAADHQTVVALEARVGVVLHGQTVQAHVDIVQKGLEFARRIVNDSTSRRRS